MTSQSLSSSSLRMARARFDVAEWVKVLCLLAGVAATPLLAGLPWPWLSGRYWAVGLTAGALATGLGVYYGVRAFIKARALARAANPDKVLGAARLEQYVVKVYTRPAAAQAAAAPGSLAAELAELKARLTKFGLSQKEYDAEKKALLASASAVQYVLPQDNIYRQAMVLVCIGVFILLPACAALLMQILEVENAPLVTAYLESPALAIWITFEIIRFLSFWRRRGHGMAVTLALARSGAQILAAWMIWNYLGQAYGSAWAAWQFWLAAALAVFGALASDFIRSGDDAMASVSARPAPAGSESGAFVISQTADQKYVFHLQDSSGMLLLTSGAYASLVGCQGGVRSAQTNAALAERYAINQLPAGGYAFALKAANERVLANSPLFTSRSECESGIVTARALAPSAAVRLPARPTSRRARRERMS